MPRTEKCQSCLGTGEIQVPTIREKIANHLIYTANHPQYPNGAGLALGPHEVLELAEALGITEAELAPLEELPDAGEV